MCAGNSTAASKSGSFPFSIFQPLAVENGSQGRHPL